MMGEPPPLPSRGTSLGGVITVGVICLFCGGVLGFCAGVQSVEMGKEFLEALMQEEEAADVDSPLAYDREGFRLEYPGNWKIDEDADEHDPDLNVTISSVAGTTTVTLMVDETPLDLTEHVEILVVEYEEILTRPERTSILRWGAHVGAGVQLKGRSVGMRSETLIFAFQHEGRTFTVIAQTWEDDLTEVQPGLDLIERTLEVR